MAEPLISIVIPVFNVEKYIEECVSSVTTETALRSEIILVDDGSTDKSADIIRSWFASRPEYSFKLISKTNGGASSARNAGIRESTGKYILFLDSDDSFIKEGLEQLVRILEKTDSDIIIGGYVKNTDGVLSEIRRKFDPERFNNAGAEKALGMFTDDYECIIWANVYKRSLIRDNGIYFMEGVVCEDVEWIPRVFYAAESLFFSQLCWYSYRIRGGSVMTSVYSKKETDRLKVGAAVFRFAETVKNRKFRKKLFKISNDLFRTALRNLRLYPENEAEKIIDCAAGKIFLLSHPLSFQNLLRYSFVKVFGVRAFAGLSRLLKIKK